MFTTATTTTRRHRFTVLLSIDCLYYKLEFELNVIHMQSIEKPWRMFYPYKFLVSRIKCASSGSCWPNGINRKRRSGRKTSLRIVLTVMHRIRGKARMSFIISHEVAFRAVSDNVDHIYEAVWPNVWEWISLVVFKRYTIVVQ